MNSSLYVGRVTHARKTPVEHRFVYPVLGLVLDPDELGRLNGEVRGFGYNRFNVVSVRDRDYLAGEGTVRERLDALLRDRPWKGAVRRVRMVTTPRLLGYTFNPVTFYDCRDEDGRLLGWVAEVNNTFGERHVYVLDEPVSAAGELPVRYRQAKQFHVSPFNDMRGWYELSFGGVNGDVDIGVDLYREEGLVMTARLQAETRPLSTATLRRALLRRPAAAALTFPRITVEAVKLCWRKRLRVYHKPEPSSAMTIRTVPPDRLQTACRRLVLRSLSGVRRGRLTVVLPDGATQCHGDAAAGEDACLRVHNAHCFQRVVLGGDIGLGEAYTAGEWSSDDLAALFRLLIDNMDAIEAGGAAGGWMRAADVVRHALRSNTRAGSRRNIRAHYDLGNAFYRTFLDDETLLYSCGIFRSPRESLGQAQLNKVHRLLELAAVGPSDHVLEIGCGWGGFAIEAARRTGCRVTGITISDAQHALARERVAAAGLEDRVEILLRDYRDMEGAFDAVVSIEMLEAVGHRYYGTFFAACDRLLKPGGRAAVQVITIPDQRYAAYRRRTDWIQKHIFPGGMLPSLTELCSAMTLSSRLTVDRLENIGPHYAPTLRLWRERFNAAAGTVADLGFDEEFRRKWNYYFSYCEAAFERRYLNDLQLVLRRAEPAGPARPAPCPPPAHDDDAAG